MISRTYILFIAFMSISVSLIGQEGFKFLRNKKKDRIHFELVNNLPVIQVEVNGTRLSFILDTGVKNSILFSLEAVDSVHLEQTSSVRLRGLGGGDYIEALRSLGNTLRIGNTEDENHSLYIIFDSGLNFSPRMGIPIHGILGNEFFRNFVVKINYTSEVITIYDPNTYSFRKCRKCEDLVIEFDEDKPYIDLLTISGGIQREVTVLIDTGSSDVMWLFNQDEFIEESPKNYFKDFLGLGLGGNIFGKRTQVPELIIGKFHLKNVNTSFPEEKAIVRARLFQERDGSVGGGFLSRFTVIFDYKRNLVRLKKNGRFDKPFHYDMSGLILEHEGMELIKVDKQAVVNIDPSRVFENNNRNIIPLTTELQFSLVPRYVVVNVREDSAAHLAGIEIGDAILSINGKPNYKYKLYQLIELFSSEEGKKITMEIERNGIKMKIKFYLKSVF